MPRKTLFQRSSKNSSHFFWRIDFKGHFETAKLINDHSQRPNIALSTVTLLLVVPNLGTNIERRTSPRFGHASLRNYFTHIQISQLEPFFFVSENIGRFYIPVGNLMLMQVFHCLCHIQQNFPHCLLRNSSPFLLGLLDQLRKVPSVRILQKNVKIVMLFVEKAIMELNDMRVVERGEDSDLIESIGQFVLAEPKAGDLTIKPHTLLTANNSAVSLFSNRNTFP